jgi:hypothetical protein
MEIQSSEQPPHSAPARSEEETILESSLESFPASDPPAWVYGRDIPPKTSPSKATEQRDPTKGDIGCIKRLAAWLMGRLRVSAASGTKDRGHCRGPQYHLLKIFV